MTPPHRRVRIPEYIIQVNTVGANVGAIFIYLYFIDIKQLLKASKWPCCQTNKLRHQIKGIPKILSLFLLFTSSQKLVQVSTH